MIVEVEVDVVCYYCGEPLTYEFNPGDSILSVQRCTNCNIPDTEETT